MKLYKSILSGRIYTGNKLELIFENNESLLYLDDILLEIKSGKHTKLEMLLNYYIIRG